jgi:hypothetical protein
MPQAGKDNRLVNAAPFSCTAFVDWMGKGYFFLAVCELVHTSVK